MTEVELLEREVPTLDKKARPSYYSNDKTLYVPLYDHRCEFVGFAAISLGGAYDGDPSLKYQFISAEDDEEMGYMRHAELVNIEAIKLLRFGNGRNKTTGGAPSAPR